MCKPYILVTRDETLEVVTCHKVELLFRLKDEIGESGIK